MGERGTSNAAALQAAVSSVQALGRGFDVNFETRLLYCKGNADSRIVEVDDEPARDICLYDDVVVRNVSNDIKTTQESTSRHTSGVLTFNEVSSISLFPCLMYFLSFEAVSFHLSLNPRPPVLNNYAILVDCKTD